MYELQEYLFTETMHLKEKPTEIFLFFFSPKANIIYHLRISTMNIK